MKITLKTILNHLLGFLIVFLISVLISYGFIGPRLFGSLSTFLINITFGLLIGISFWKGNQFLGRYFGRKLSWSKNQKRAFVKFLLILLGYGLFICMVYPLVFFHFILKIPISRCINTILWTALFSLIADYIIISVYYINIILNHYKKSIETQEMLKRENITAQYETLKNQINPHFLFNSLNTISTLITKNPETAEKFIKQLSEVYRYVLEYKDKDLVDIETELKFIDSYIYLHKIRFADNLVINNSIKTGDFYIAPLSIQILVENAVKHNIISDSKPLTLELYCEESYLVVANNLQKKKIIESKDKIGLENIKSRYDILSDKPVIIEESEEKFVVKIPLIYSSQYDHINN
jgi:two-component system LytT family sensor kinase